MMLTILNELKIKLVIKRLTRMIFVLRLYNIIRGKYIMFKHVKLNESVLPKSLDVKKNQDNVRYYTIDTS